MPGAQKDLDRRRAPRNGIGLDAGARENVADLVCRLNQHVYDVTEALRRVRYDYGSKRWRGECMTVEQRARLKKQVDHLRAEMAEW